MTWFGNSYLESAWNFVLKFWKACNKEMDKLKHYLQDEDRKKTDRKTKNHHQ